jgi:hypothetical protein
MIHILPVLATRQPMTMPDSDHRPRQATHTWLVLVIELMIHAMLMPDSGQRHRAGHPHHAGAGHGAHSTGRWHMGTNMGRKQKRAERRVFIGCLAERASDIPCSAQLCRKPPTPLKTMEFNSVSV